MIRVTATVTFISLLLISCDSGPPPQALVVYAVGNDELALTEKLAEFTDDTRIPVTLVFSKSSRNADLVIDNSGSPPADVLMTNNVADIWRAADDGALLPISADTFDRADPLLRDADGFWVAIGVRSHAIASLNDSTHLFDAGYDQLASPDMQGKVCLSSSALHVNRSLIAMLINDRGVKTTERLLRAWIRNLAAAPFSSEDELIAAIRDGTCDYGVLSWSPDMDDLVYYLPEPGYMDIDGIGVARHARQAESAQRLASWLLQKGQYRTVSNYELRPVSIAGWRDEDATLLAERAGYQ